MKEFKKVAVGGTFDQLHRGHRALLGKAFEVGDKVVIGLTSDAFVERWVNRIKLLLMQIVVVNLKLFWLS